ncbi:hypothetical protein EPUS_08435 [Endocarpon pusillum Z07020]|uniref:Uncharacterized protein n=1 Tax=Endocarpon pusillum (strain Z07020 / HMAS-L-300199) TaxID=1263415 RepID=U1HXH3_ENDPU|nr:uncharacterized protein EPUS_08435 [Endocarpon pusillum Z07020]ERF75530.1 hypothetical protein EPUS_08435 [Endocarpon pusillum Z07020]
MVLMAASRHRSSGGSDLGDSWVVNDSDEDESSPDEDPPTTPEEPARRQRNRSQNHRIVTQTRQPRRSSRTSSAAPEPELVMPSIHQGQVEGSWTSTKERPEAVTSPRKRNSKLATSFPGEARSDHKSRRSSQAQMRNVKSSKDAAVDHPSDRVLSVLGYSVDWFLDVFGGALKALRKPISLVIALYLFAGLMVMVQNILTRSIYSALSPVCRIPGMSLLGLPLCRTPLPQGYQDTPNAPVEFDQLMNVQGQFEEVLEASTAGISLPLDMKRGETSIRDLRQIVRFSHLNSKQEMILELDGFIETARIASYDLQKFNSHVGRGVDNVLATARWTQKVLDDIAIKKSSRGLLPAFVHDKFLAPFQPLKFTENTLLSQYIEHTRIVSDEIETLIAEAQALLYVLQNLEDRLDVIHGITLRDNIHAQGQKDEILSQLWTLLGGNRAALGKYNSQLKLLRQVGEYRKIAWAHVSGTIIRLQAMGAELEELRERVGSAELLEGRKEIPLSVHLESIRLGVERLEKGREASRELEQSHLNRVLDHGGKDKKMEIRLVEG